MQAPLLHALSSTLSCSLHATPCPPLKHLYWSPSTQMIARLGQEINHPDSIYYWAWRNNIPVFCPALTGALRLCSRLEGRTGI